MQPLGKTVSILLVCLSLLLTAFASPALAALRGKAADFAGTWDTLVPENGARYVLTLDVKGKQVTGIFANPNDPRFNGKLTGTVDPSKDGTASGGRLEYTYVQDNGGTGGGYFIVGDDNTIAGFTYTDQAKSKKYGWEGKRLGDPVKKPVNQVLIKSPVTGYDEPEGDEKCYLEGGQTAKLLGVGEDDENWMHLKGDGKGVCNGKDFWVYDDGTVF